MFADFGNEFRPDNYMCWKHNVDQTLHRMFTDFKKHHIKYCRFMGYRIECNVNLVKITPYVEPKES